MKKTITQNLKVFMTLCLLLFGVTTSWAEEGDYKELFTVTSDDVVTNSSYTAYSTTVKDCGDWIVTFGGNNLSVGTNKSNHTKCTLANYTKYAVSPVKATDYASAFVSTSELDNVGKITFSISGGSYQTNTDVYVIYSSDGETFTQLRTKSDLVCKVCPIADKTLYEFEFAKLSGYFGLLFKEATPNTSQNWRIDNVSITLYEEVTISTTPSINASNITLGADTEFGEIKYSISNPVEGKSISASTTADWISNFAYTDSTVTFTTEANTTTAERTANITLTYEGATDKVVKVTQAKPVPTYASLAELVDAGEPTETGETVKVTLTNDTIKSIYVSGAYRNGVFLNAGNKEIEIYCRNVPETWKVGGTLSGTLTCLWKKYNDIWELCPDSWEGLEYAYNVTTYKVICDTTVANGTISADLSKAAAGDKVTLTIKPNEHYYLDSVSVKETLSGNNVELTKDYTFIMPACDVTVSATFAESAKYYVIYTSLGEEVGDGEEVYAGECIANAPEVTAPEGWEFAGWTADETFTTSTTVPTYFTAETPITQDTILYAVFSKTFGEGGEEAFVKVTSSLDDWTGNYLIVYETDSLAFNGSLETLDAVSNTVKVNIVDDKIAAVDAMKNIMFTVGVKSDGIYNLKSASGYYISGTTTVAKAGNGLKQAESDKDYEITFDYDETDGVLVYSQSSDQKMTLRYNKASDQKRFRFYKSGQQPVALYRYEGNSATIYSTTTVFDDYTREGLTEGNLGTICLESDALVEGAQAYEISSMTKDGDNISSITFSPVEKVEGGKGYLFVASGSELTAEYISEAKTEAENNGLVGSLEGTDVAEGKYIINSNKVKKCGTGCSIAANRAYIDPTKYVDELPAKGETITIELETPTSINELMQKVTAPGQWYNLNGQPVAQPTKGVFTKNGVKYIFK